MSVDPRVGILAIVLNLSKGFVIFHEYFAFNRKQKSLENLCQFPHFSSFNKESLLEKDKFCNIDLGCIKGQNCVLYSPNLIT